jgi:hypothetical protein
VLLPFAPQAPTWHLTGPTLAYAAPAPKARALGALYRDALWGAFDTRELYRNTTGKTLELGVALDNPAPFAVRVRGWSVGDQRAASAAFVLEPHAHRVWAVALPPGRAATLNAHGTATLTGLGPLDGLAAPVLVTLFATAGMPAAPAALPAVPRSGGTRATFAHAQADLVLQGSATAPTTIAPSQVLWPRLPAVDAVDGRTAWGAGPPEFAPFLDLRLPATAPGTAWRVVLRCGAGQRVLATYPGARKASRRLLALPTAALASGSVVTLAAVRTPAPHPQARGRCVPRQSGSGAPTRG